MAAAARSQGKHKQRIWVNISMSGIKIIDEKSGVSSDYCCNIIWTSQNLFAVLKKTNKTENPCPHFSGDRTRACGE